MRESHLSEGKPEILLFQPAVIREINNYSHIFVQALEEYCFFG